MKKFFIVVFMSLAALVVSTCFLSCDKDEESYYSVEKSLFGEWETDLFDADNSTDIVWYQLQIVASEKHNVSPFRMYIKRKNGKLQVYKKGYMGHKNEDNNNVITFTDNYKDFDTWSITIKWLNKEKTRVVLFHDFKHGDIVFHKTKESTEYTTQW